MTSDSCQAVSQPLTISVDGATLNLVHQPDGDGWRGLQFFLQTEGHTLACQSLAAQNSGNGESTWLMKLSQGATLRCQIAALPSGGALLRLWLRNEGQNALRFSGYGWRTACGAAGPSLCAPGLAVYAHSENLRYENLPLSRPTYPFVRPLSESTRWYGRQGVGPMPALVLGKTNSDRWLLEASATQNRHALSWHLGLPTAAGQMLDYCAQFFWNGASLETLEPGQEIELESTYFFVLDGPPDRFYQPWMDALAKEYGPRLAGTQSRLSEQPVYCTWNYGIYTHLNQADCLRRIDLVAKTQKTGIFQLDHGYQPPHAPNESWGYADAYYPDPSGAWDPARFPGGPEAIVAACRRRGLSPAIWWTPRMDIGGPIQRDHPDWIAVGHDGKPIPFVGDLHPDYSVPEARQFVQRTLQTVIHQWGFEGIKLDFFSWAFDSFDVVYRNGGTSVQWRRWLLEMIRKELGPRGYFLHCVSCPLGNPFLALDGCDSYRAGSDIDHGGWEIHLANSSWLLASFPAVGRQSWFADMDSFMGSMKFPISERRFRCAMGYMTCGMMDISGPVETFDAMALADYRKLARRCDQGTQVRVIDRAAFTGSPLPTILHRPHTPESKTRREFSISDTIALFNWSDQPQTLAVALAQLGVDPAGRKARDFWTGRAVKLTGQTLVALLEPREHLLVDIVQ